MDRVCRVVELEAVRTLRALPDGLYHTNDIAPMWFRKERGVIVCRNGRHRTFEEFVERYKSIVGPFRDEVKHVKDCELGQDCPACVELGGPDED